MTLTEVKYNNDIDRDQVQQWHRQSSSTTITLTEAKYNNDIDRAQVQQWHRQSSSITIASTHSRGQVDNCFHNVLDALDNKKLIIDIVFIDIAIMININNIDSWQWAFNSPVPTPGSATGTCVVNIGVRHLFNIVNIKINSTTWQIENQQIANQCWEFWIQHWEFRDQQSQLHQHQEDWEEGRQQQRVHNELIRRRKRTTTKSSTISYNVSCSLTRVHRSGSTAHLWTTSVEWTTRSSTQEVHRKRSSATSASTPTSKEVKYNKSIDPYIGRGQVQ